MIDQPYMQTLKAHLHSYAELRREVITISGAALHVAKRAIFSMHRLDMKEAEKKIAEAKEGLKRVQKLAKKQPKLLGEGSYKAALEEYVEAVLFMRFMKKKPIGPIKGMPISEEIYIAGLGDVPGELYRYAIRSATEGNADEVKRAHEQGSAIIESLMECDLTKYLRTKFDQAKSALQKLEIVMYELKIREK
ncbi:MAG: hypothetical protein HOE53_04360 [Candidatus Magasanikbacteria bacterium]|jgi:translin|nr:hypothetical protein [Candidatus Magasanikbacteria bacterium]